MISLLADAIEAHGGERRWRALGRLSGTFVIQGELWELKGVLQDAPRVIHIDLHRQWASVEELRRSLPMVAKMLSQIIAERRRQGVALFRKFVEIQEGARHG